MFVPLTPLSRGCAGESITPSYPVVLPGASGPRGRSPQGDGESGRRAIHLDIGSFRFCTRQMLERFKRMTVLRPYLDEKIADRPWPQLTMNTEPALRIEGDTATVVTEIYSDDNWPIRGKIKYRVTPQDAVENPRMDVKMYMPSYQHRLVKQTFKVLDKTKPLQIKVTGDFLIDDERVILNQQAATKP